MAFGDAVSALLGERSVVLGFFLAAAITLLLTPLVKTAAMRLGLVDRGDDRPRIHKTPVPHIGGLAMAVGIFVPAILLIDLRGSVEGIVLAIPLVVAIGLYDDIRGLHAGPKMLLIVGAALIPVIGYDLRLERIGLPFIGVVEFGTLSVAVTLLWIVAVTNIVNLIDGMDSLAAGIVAIAAASFALLAASFGRLGIAALSAMVCGAALAFLRHNYHPATIFMGDSGALTLGFVLGSLAVEGTLKNAATIALAAPLLIMAVPILDTSFVVAKRLKYRRAPWSPDQNHFAHRFLRIGHTQRRTAAYLHAWAVVLASYAMLLRFKPPRPFGLWDTENTIVAAVIGAVVVLGSIWMIFELEILKARHLEALRLRRIRPEAAEALEPESEREEAVEEFLNAGAATGAPDPAAPADRGS